jgi:YcaO-like protein with predicted kinase domain
MKNGKSKKNLNMNSQILEYDRQHSPFDLAQGLLREEKVLYSENGNRSISGKKFLQKIEKLAPRMGITRLADISFLFESRYPVYQSCRPNVNYHSRFGQNTGSQGKGPSPTQAKISCLMETIECYSQETRNPALIRASYDFLQAHHLVIDPLTFIQVGPPPGPSEPLMWTPALSVQTGKEVLIPAEMVFFPFLPQNYMTKEHFVSGTNGLASGATYLEATIHGLYELIERYYGYLFEEGKVKVEALFEDELDHPAVRQMKKNQADQEQFEVQLYSYEIEGIRNLPMVYCVLVSDDICYQGWGCSANLEISIDRAISEALQCWATTLSGSREDMEDISDDTPAQNPLPDRHAVELFATIPQPEKRTLHIQNYRRRIHDKIFKNLRDEYRFILKWLKDLGFTEIYLANLTRAGIDIPVVKSIVLKMQMGKEYKHFVERKPEDLPRSLFPNIWL